MRLLRQSTAAAKSAGRHFRKNRFYGSLNMLGLSIAFASLILVAAYLFQETTYESFHKKADRIYRPTYHVSGQNNFDVHFARIPVNYVNELPKEIPEIEKLIRFQNQEQKYVRIGEKRFKPNRAYVADKDVFEVFDLPLIAGDPTAALAQPYSVVLAESLARKYFSNTNIIGKEMTVSGDWSADEQVFQVTGVLKDLPVNTHLPIEILFSFASEEERSGWAYVYALLAEGASIAEVEKKTPGFIENHTDTENGPTISFEYQPLADIHLQSNLAREIVANGQIIYIRIFFWAGLFIWIIALINFANLSAALTLSRGKEAGVRKVLGASKSQLVSLAMAETVVYSLVSLLLGALIAFLVWPSFSRLTGIALLPPIQYFLPFLLLVALLSGLLAGILPSLVVRSIKIIDVVKQGNNWSMKGRAKNVHIKRAMIAVQFCAAIILLGGATVAQLQFKYINDKNLGLKPDQVIAISDVPDRVTSQYMVFKNRINALPGVKEVSACMQTPSSEIRDLGPVLIRGVNEDAEQAPMMDIQIIDPDFISMMDLEFLAGEDFSAKVRLKPPPEFNEALSPQDYLAEAPRKYLINETAMKQLGWQTPEEALGKEIKWSIGSFQLAYGPVTGVLKDYHQESLKNKVDPLVMVVEPIWLRTFLIKVETANLEKTIASVENVWNDLFPYALEYAFLDELFDRIYKQDRVQLKLLSSLSFIAILISFVGLISLVAYALKRRSKELAVRRVVGADLRSLTTLIGREYIWILAIATLAGVPISYRWVSDWLQNFAYHIPVSPFLYALPVALVFALLVVTIYLQTLQATIDNPIKALREE